jgi:hypothetical protein
MKIVTLKVKDEELLEVAVDAWVRALNTIDSKFVRLAFLTLEPVDTPQARLAIANHNAKYESK